MYRYSGIQVQVLPPSSEEEWWDRLEDLMYLRRQGRAVTAPMPEPLSRRAIRRKRFASRTAVSAPTPTMATVLPAPVFKRATTVSAPAVERATVLTTPVPQRAVTIPAPVVKIAAIPASQPLPEMAASPISPAPAKPQLLVSSLLDPQITSAARNTSSTALDCDADQFAELLCGTTLASSPALVAGSACGTTLASSPALVAGSACGTTLVSSPALVAGPACSTTLVSSPALVAGATCCTALAFSSAGSALAFSSAGSALAFSSPCPLPPHGPGPPSRPLFRLHSTTLRIYIGVSGTHSWGGALL
ncbi:hypothetical protein Q7C36_019835 [Tachysurus vachellii]|uniref:Uncharacterized protein n=1 Tax=Tachysurus vachellii TaxID=175792 RepID=A0AA88LSK0_TACVA|nr:hypothetical protein Q7C36_019835 [Tachysurus vachellii]